MPYLNNTIKLTTISLLGLAATACVLTPSKDPQVVCTQLKRQLVYYQSNRSNIEAKWTTAWQRSEFEQKIRDNHCE